MSSYEQPRADRQWFGAAVRGRLGERSFRPDAPTVPEGRPTRRQSVALLAVLVLVAGAVTAAGYLIRPGHARSFTLLHGSVFLADQVAPVGVDLATGKPTLRLVGAEKQVGARSPSDLSVVPVDDGTLLLDRTSGQFNMVDNTGFVIKHDDGGVPLPARTDTTTSTGVATGSSAFIERTGRTGTGVYLVDQLTVQTATNPQQRVAPRASARVSEVGSTAPGASAAADGTFWALLGTGTSRTVHEFSLPAGADRGARLTDAQRAGVTGPAAIGTAGRTGPPAATTDPADPAVITSDAGVGVASADGIRYFGATAPRDGRELSYSRQTGLDAVLAASAATTRLVFLLHSSSGWSITSVARDGTDLNAPRVLHGVPRDAQLAPPAMSEGAAYTIDRASGAMYRIDLAGAAAAVPGARRYPLAEPNGRVAESADFGDAYVTASGPRVFVDSPSHVDAVTLFTDGSHAPLMMRKSAAVDVSAADGALALAQGKAGSQRSTRPHGQTKPPKNAGQLINNRVDCRAIDQKPHIPVITQATPGSRSVSLAWSYPLLDNQDCTPSTYVVSVRLLSGNAPQPAGTTVVQGQQSTIVGGLYPQARYQVSVAAYLHGQGTASSPVQITTGKEGPAAPTGVAATTDTGGNWHVTFDSCGPMAHGCVPAASWRVVASFCDGQGLSVPPDPVVAPADPSSVTQPEVTVPTSDDLLGRGLRFQVEGTGTAGEAGTPSAPSACVFSSTAPQSGALTLTASTPSRVAFGADATANLTLDLGSNPVRAVGGVGAQVTFQLSGGGVTRSRGPVPYDGTQSTLSVDFDGVRAGGSYAATATVSAPHGGGSAQVTAPGISTRSDWPQTALDASCPSDGATSLSCSLHLSINGISSAAAEGETFDFGGKLTCGNTSRDVVDTGFDPANHTIVVPGLSQLDDYYGTCQVDGKLTEHSPGGDAVFGGTPSRPASTSVDLGTARSGDVTFTAQWAQSSAIAEIHASASNPNFDKLTTGWDEKVLAPNGSVCNESHDPVTPDTSVPISQDCLDTYGGQDGWSVSITYDERIGSGSHGPITAAIDNKPPGYIPPCTVDDQAFTATWPGAQADGLSVSYNGAAAGLDGCSDFTYQLQDSTGAPCSDSVDIADPTQAVALQPTCNPADVSTVSIGWHERRSDQDDSTTTTVPPPPPS